MGAAAEVEDSATEAAAEDPPDDAAVEVPITIPAPPVDGAVDATTEDDAGEDECGEEEAVDEE